jgi:hypothetical protein
MVALLRRVWFMSHAARAAFTGAVIVLAFGLAIGADFYISEYAALATVRQLCGIINLMVKDPVSKPANPKANPSREKNYLQYEQFLDAKHYYRC